MKTKKLFACLVLSVPLFLSTVQAQGLYLGVGGGYGFAAGKMDFGNNSTSTSSGSVNTVEYKSNPISMGTGINLGLFAGYMLNKNVGVELGISYLMGKQNLMTNEGTTTSGSFSSSYTNENKVKGSMLRLVPTLRMTAGEDKVRPYVKAGLIIGMAGKVVSESTDTQTSGGVTTVDVDTYEYTGGIGIGFHGALGINYMLSEKLAIFVELAGNYQSYAPKKEVHTISTTDGADNLAGATTSQLETEFLKEYTYSNASPIEPGSPSKSTKIFLPFSSFGINLGIIIPLGGGGE